MEDKRIIYLIIIVIIAIVLATGVGILLYQRMNLQSTPPPPPEQPTEPNGSLPHLDTSASNSWKKKNSLFHHFTVRFR